MNIGHKSIAMIITRWPLDDDYNYIMMVSKISTVMLSQSYLIVVVCCDQYEHNQGQAVATAYSWLHGGG
jgi:hypothetical protein